jgi:hypothetical protein
MVDFENRRAADFVSVSTGSAESRRLQPGLSDLTLYSMRRRVRRG